MTDSEKFFYELNQSISSNYKSLLQSPAVRRYIDRLLIDNEDLAVSSVQKYLPHVASFCEFAKVNSPDEMIDDVGRRKLKADYHYEDLLDAWFKELKDRFGEQRDTAIAKISTVLAFFKKNRVELSYDPPKKSKKGGIAWKPEKELLRQAFLSIPATAEGMVLRSWVLIQSQCGLSEIDILHYDVDRFSDGKSEEGVPAFESVRLQYNRGACPISFVIPRQKTGQTTITFLGEEAISLLNFHGDRLFPWKPDAKDPGRTIRENFQRIIQPATGERRLSPHKLRHYFKTVLDNCDFHPNTVNRMMGHSLGKVQGAYNASSIEELRPKYLTAYPKLRLFEPEFKDRLATLTMKDFSS